MKITATLKPAPYIPPTNPFPCARVSESGETVVLFTSEKAGVVLTKSPGAGLSVGGVYVMASEYPASHPTWTPYYGKVELTFSK